MKEVQSSMQFLFLNKHFRLEEAFVGVLPVRFRRSCVLVDMKSAK